MQIINGLHSGTKIATVHTAPGRSLEAHWQPEDKVVVVLEVQCVPDGQGCVDYETEVVAVLDRVPQIYNSIFNEQLCQTL